MRSHLLKIVLIAVVALPGCSKEPASRQEAVAEKGASVMPFDLDRSTHVFEKIDNGGLQQVFSDDGDTSQVKSIRVHLEEEAAKFAQGDFHDPASIHGHDMPGLHALVMGHAQLSITYKDIANGGEILYTSADASLVTAIHQWFDAQLSDHGSHAQGHH